MESLATDKQKKNDTTEAKPEGRLILPAEKTFNKRLYWGLNYGIQVSTAVIASYWIKYGGGKKYFDKAAKWAGEKIIPKITSKRGVDAVKETNTYLIGASQLMVGNMFFIPIKWFENRKPHYVRKIDETMVAKQEKDGYIITPEERQRHEEALQDLEKEPRASWPTLAAARLAGISSFFVSNWIIGEDLSKAMQSKTAERIQHAFKRSGIGALEHVGHSPKVKNFLELAFVDFFYSIFVANTVFRVTTYLTPKQRHNREVKEEPKQTQPQQHDEPEKPRFVAKESQKKESGKPRTAPEAHEKFTDYVQQSAAESQVTI